MVHGIQRSGGILVRAVCSLLERQVDRFPAAVVGSDQCVDLSSSAFGGACGGRLPWSAERRWAAAV